MASTLAALASNEQHTAEVALVARHMRERLGVRVVSSAASPPSLTLWPTACTKPIWPSRSSTPSHACRRRDAAGRRQPRAGGALGRGSALASLEEEAPEGGFLVGAFSVADLALVSLVLKLPGALRPSGLGLPRLSRWEAASLARPGVSSAMAAPRAPLIESGNAPIVRQSSSTRA